MEPIIELFFGPHPSFGPEDDVLHAIARQYIEATDAHRTNPSCFESFYRWLEYPEHADLHTRWFEAAETIPAFRDGDTEQWELRLLWVFNIELAEWKRRLTR